MAQGNNAFNMMTVEKLQHIYCEICAAQKLARIYGIHKKVVLDMEFICAASNHKYSNKTQVKQVVVLCYLLHSYS